MARILPDGWRELAVTGAAQREIETLALLAERLPGDYTVYHAVHWTNLEQGFAAFGEIDFVVVSPAGHLLLIEQKSGFLEEGPDGLLKRYEGRVKRVAVQMSRSAGALRTKLGRRPGCLGAHVDSLLYCPDYRVRHPDTAGVVAERIVDADRREQLPAVIARLLPVAAPAADARLNPREVHRFLRDIIQLESDVSTLLGRARDMVTRISGGLAHWARQIEMTPWRLRVTGTAGSGKTQLALAEYRAAIDAGRRPLYVCFNRPLADHFAAIAPSGRPGQGLACTFHMLCDRIVRAHGETPDFSAPDAFARLEARAAELPVSTEFRFDTVIVDEGQDFSEAWRDLVLRLAGAGARLLWLEDPLQNLYGRPPVALPGWVGLRAASNYRSPRGVARMLRGLLPEDGQRLEAHSPFEAGEVEILAYADTAGMLQQVKEAIRLCYSAGFRKQDVAIVSYHGREHSQLMRHDRLGANTLRSFSGSYDLLGQPVYGQGDLLLESVYRFKGQAAPAVIFAEIDFETLDDRALRKLFVGTTRAMLKLVLVISEGAGQQLLARLETAV
ncbi:ATP-binding domain-containing protein [Sulfurisoma sediminicola]|uniref:DNA 3'-5' helicase II n=1 Tax=Sulfurisoma sediminicola TaxID=1381557 RepID=A0A497XCZ6_9PROT|nr:ATP-binding domain-containing protein [Sulfurisoma sediminicola]RLJ64823.1 nuclease-like protein [Sulfurisoma sediminicola]